MPLAHLHLHEVATGNQLLGTFHGGNVVGLGEVALRFDSLGEGLTSGALTACASLAR